MLTLRRATEDDIPDLLELEQGVIQAERPFNEVIKSADVKYYDFDHLLDNENALVLVAEDARKIVASGYIEIRASKPQFIHDRHGYLGFMYVLPAYRGQGVNQLMLKKLMHWCRHKGVNHFYLDVYARNKAAIRAYEKAGFIPSMLEMQLIDNEN